MNKVVFNGEECNVKYAEYCYGGTAIQLNCQDGEPMAVATVNIDGLSSDEVAIKDYSENRGMLTALLQANIVYSPHRYVSTGHIVIPICTLVKHEGK